MSRKYFLYPNPLDSLCQLQHDSGWTSEGTPSVDASGRLGQVINIPDSTPDQWGARLVISKQGKQSLMLRGFLVLWDVNTARFQADDFTLADPIIIVQPPVPPVPNPNPPNPIPSDPAAIVQWTYNNGIYNLATKAGCGKFTEDCCTNLHNNSSASWGHVKKSGAQNQYNGHAVDAVQILIPKGSTAAGIYDLIVSSESPDAHPAFNFAGPPAPDLWYYPA